ncbi:sensor domain-containing diguanylate cyclase [Reinekea forsetii]|nr:sensor domain-containing diguanylate cyclase [Reinekea forsetii]
MAGLILWLFYSTTVSALDVGSDFKRINIKDICEAFVANESFLNSPDVARELITSQQWQPCSEVKLSRGYTKDRLWIKIDFTNHNLEVETAYLNLFPSWITEISHYHFEGSTLKRWKNDGIAFPFHHREIPSSNIVLPLINEPGKPATTLLHVQTDLAFLIGGTLLSETEALKSGVTVNLINGILIGAIVMIGLYNLFIYFSLRDSNYLYYFLYNASMLLMLSVIYGFGYQFIWPDAVKFNTFLESAAGPFLGIFMSQFVRRFLDLSNVSKALDRILVFFILASALVVVLTMLPSLNDKTSVWSGVLAIIGAPVVLLAGVRALLKKQVSAGYFLVAWALSLISITLFGLMITGLLEFNLILFYSFGIGAVLEMLLLSFALANKIHVLQIEKAQAIDAVLQAEKEKSRSIALAAAQLEHKVSVRTHDLAQEKRRAEVLARTDPLTGLNNRRAFFEKGEKLFSGVRLSAGEKSLAVIMADIDHFKKINDRYGHSVGDVVITSVALKLLPCFLGNSVIGRIGGEEFAIAIEGFHFEEVVAKAEHARQMISQTLTEIANGKDVTATISLGVAQFSSEDQNIDETLARADMALYQAKEQGRNRVVSIP